MRGCGTCQYFVDDDCIAPLPECVVSVEKLKVVAEAGVKCQTYRPKPITCEYCGNPNVNFLGKDEEGNPVAFCSDFCSAKFDGEER